MIATVGVSQSIRNLMIIENVGAFGQQVFKSMILGLRQSNLTQENMPEHACPGTIGKKNAKDTCCIQCLPYKFMEMGQKVQTDGTRPFVSDKISKILLGYLILGASYSTPILEVTNPKEVLYAPHCVAARVIAWSVAMANGLIYDGSD
ncbi:unnamed protein product, partial [Nesidiocoris tenuis]